MGIGREEDADAALAWLLPIIIADDDEDADGSLDKKNAAKIKTD